MNVYKKTSAKFCNEEYSRVVRHAETLKARESSRFERLSMIRDINDSDFEIEEMEPIKPDDTKNIVKPTASRLEMLFKWKQEKRLKKEFETKFKKKPFYIGGNANQPTTIANKTSQHMKSSFMNQTNSTNFNASKIIKSKLLVPKAPSLPSKLPNFSRQTNSAQKHLGFTNKGNNMSGLPKTITKSYGGSGTTINRVPSFQKAVKMSNVPPVKNPFNKKIIKSNVTAVKTTHQESSLPKIAVAKFPNNVLKGSLPKIISTTKFSNKSIPKIPDPIPKPPVLQKKIPDPIPKPPVLQKKIPVLSSIKQKSEPSQIKETSLCKKNITTRKGYCFKESVASTHKKKTECKNAMKQDLEKSNKEIKNNYEVGSLSRKHPEVSLNCDVSIINPATKSFAPDHFEFIPPAELSEFIFDDDDPYEALEQVRLKFMSRTSTPTKEPERSSNHLVESPLDIKNSQEKSIRDNDGKGDVNEEKYIEEDINKETINEENLNLRKDIEENISEKKDISKENIDDQNDFNEKNAINKENGESDNTLKLHNSEDLKIDTYEELSACTESPFDIIDLKLKEKFEGELELLNLKDEKVNIIDILEKPESIKNEEGRKPARVYKRVSMLKSVSTLNAISEADDCLAESLVDIPKDNVNSIITPRRSKRLSASSQQQLNFLTETIFEENTLRCFPSSPRRSSRLQKMKLNNEIVDTSPFEQRKSTSKIGPRRSLRLIDLNTPEKDANDQSCSKTNITTEFEKLNLLDSENTDPNTFLIDFENSPGIPTGIPTEIKPRKVSLLYTPEKNRKTVRKSIRGDLMAFSPSN